MERKEAGKRERAMEESCRPRPYYAGLERWREKRPVRGREQWRKAAD
jgi:hypothetical protein